MNERLGDFVIRPELNEAIKNWNKKLVIYRMNKTKKLKN